jgi:hypothetical protein
MARFPFVGKVQEAFRFYRSGGATDGCIRDAVNYQTNVEVVLCGPDGSVKTTRRVHNTVTTAGKSYLSSLQGTSPQSAMNYMAVGIYTGSATAPTALTSELDRNTLTTRLDSAALCLYQGDWAAGDGTGSLAEVGILNSTAGGAMLAYAIFSVVNKAAADSLSIKWTVTAS